MNTVFGLIMAGTWSAVVVLGQASPVGNGGNPAAEWSLLAILGSLVTALIWFAKNAIGERDWYKAQNKELHDRIELTILPALAAATTTVGQSRRSDREVSDVLAELQELLHPDRGKRR